MTSPGVAEPSRTTLAPYQNPVTNVARSKKSLRPILIAHATACLRRLAVASFTRRTNRSDSSFCALCALTVEMAAVARSTFVLASAKARRSAEYRGPQMTCVMICTSTTRGIVESVTMASTGDRLSASAKHKMNVEKYCTALPNIWVVPIRTSSVSLFRQRVTRFGEELQLVPGELGHETSNANRLAIFPFFVMPHAHAGIEPLHPLRAYSCEDRLSEPTDDLLAMSCPCDTFGIVERDGVHACERQLEAGLAHAVAEGGALCLGGGPGRERIRLEYDKDVADDD